VAKEKMMPNPKAGAKNKKVVDTAKALIALYKSAFGDRWEAAFIETVVVEIEVR
jgi:hypothetical protein